MAPPEQTTRVLQVPQGQIAVTISTNPSAPAPFTLLLLHSNSSSSRPFQPILSNPPPNTSRVVAFDFLGHGASSNASADLDHEYTMRGYAESALIVLKSLSVTSFLALGWSLGGHVAIELLPLLEAAAPPKKITCRGVMLVGAPPANGIAQVDAAFDVSKTGQVEVRPTDPGDPDTGLGAAEVWSERGARLFTEAVHGRPVEPWMLEVGRRTDGRARRIMFGSFRGGMGADQRGIVAETKVPVAVVNGARETFVNLDYVDGVRFGNLWRGRCFRIEGAGHAPFWQKPEVFREYLWEFAGDCQP